MHVATISGNELAGVTDILGKIAGAVSDAGRVVTGVVAAGCGVVGNLPAAHPYITAAQAGCQVGTGVGMIPGSGGQPVPITTGPTGSSAGGKLLAASTQQVISPALLAQLQTPQTGLMSKPSSLVADGADKPFYKKPWFWAAIGGGVLVVGGGAVLLSRR